MLAKAPILIQLPRLQIYLWDPAVILPVNPTLYPFVTTYVSWYLKMQPSGRSITFKIQSIQNFAEGCSDHLYPGGGTRYAEATLHSTAKIHHRMAGFDILLVVNSPCVIHIQRQHFN